MGILRTAIKTIKYGVLITSAVIAGLWLYEAKFSPAPYNSIAQLEQAQQLYQEPRSLEIVLEESNGEVIPYLTDQSRGLKQPITWDFQLGSASYRLKGLFDEGAGSLFLRGNELVEYLTNNYKNTP